MNSFQLLSLSDLTSFPRLLSRCAPIMMAVMPPIMTADRNRTPQNAKLSIDRLRLKLASTGRADVTFAGEHALVRVEPKLAREADQRPVKRHGILEFEDTAHLRLHYAKGIYCFQFLLITIWSMVHSIGWMSSRFISMTGWMMWPSPEPYRYFTSITSPLTTLIRPISEQPETRFKRPCLSYRRTSTPSFSRPSFSVLGSPTMAESVFQNFSFLWTLARPSEYFASSFLNTQPSAHSASNFAISAIFSSLVKAVSTTLISAWMPVKCCVRRARRSR